MFYRPVVISDTYNAEVVKDEVETNFHLKQQQQQQQQQEQKQPQEEIKNENSYNHKFDHAKKTGCSCFFFDLYHFW
jgi:hypothetical protein